MLVMRRYELTDEAWARLEPLLPSNRRRGHPWSDHRTVLNGILWVLHTGAPWRDVPGRYGPWKTVYNRFRRWSRDGTFLRMLQALQLRLDEKGRIDWSLWCVDGSSIRASRAAAGAGKKGGPASPAIMHLVDPAEASAARSTS